jgi:hypothetical protein
MARGWHGRRETTMLPSWGDGSQLGQKVRPLLGDHRRVGKPRRRRGSRVPLWVMSHLSAVAKGFSQPRNQPINRGGNPYGPPSRSVPARVGTSREQGVSIRPTRPWSPRWLVAADPWLLPVLAAPSHRRSGPDRTGRVGTRRSGPQRARSVARPAPTVIVLHRVTAHIGIGRVAVLCWGGPTCGPLSSNDSTELPSRQVRKPYQFLPGLNSKRSLSSSDSTIVESC